MSRRAYLSVVVTVLLLASTPAVVAAQSTQAGGTVVVEPGETVDGLQATAGSIVVRGTVDGDLEGFAGTILVEEGGVVTGDVRASAGSITVLGTVEGDVESAAGSVSIGRGAVVGDDVRVAAGSLVVAGTVEGDVRAAVEQLRLGPTASVAGDVQYGTETDFVRDDGATVGGSVSAVDDLSVDPPFAGAFEDRPLGLLFGLYGVVVTLLLGAVLLLAFPAFGRDVVTEVTEEPLRSGVVGVGALVGAPIALVLVAITVVGIPLALLGLMAVGLLIFVSAVLAEYAIGAWALSYADVDSRWAALFVGVVGLALVSRIPILGDLLNLVVFLLGFGAVVVLLVRRYRRWRGQNSKPEAEGPTAAD